MGNDSYYYLSTPIFLLNFNVLSCLVFTSELFILEKLKLKQKCRNLIRLKNFAGFHTHSCLLLRMCKFSKIFASFLNNQFVSDCNHWRDQRLLVLLRPNFVKKFLNSKIGKITGLVSATVNTVQEFLDPLLVFPIYFLSH